MILSIGRTNSWLSAILEEKELAALKIYGGLDQVIKRVTTGILMFCKYKIILQFFYDDQMHLTE